MRCNIVVFHRIRTCITYSGLAVAIGIRHSDELRSIMSFGITKASINRGTHSEIAEYIRRLTKDLDKTIRDKTAGPAGRRILIVNGEGSNYWKSAREIPQKRDRAITLHLVSERGRVTALQRYTSIEHNMRELNGSSDITHQ
ncbi:hypothetical protein EVAR_98102_1 [Eumeta japonica]|uniref:Uncharacterized protein n=1 Tax=Eumeta variegata TaxID=151549 RepID=A0A4C1XKR3_EUMVA|nr:hypothetical protein EVAR_98102_1 [Eumeta japonica]